MLSNDNNNLKNDDITVRLEMFQPMAISRHGCDTIKDAIMEINGQILKGDVEIDLNSYHWKSHSHNENPEFNDVLLHIVYEDSGKYPYTISEDGNKIEILEIKEQLDDDINKLIKHYSGEPYSEKDKTCKLFNKMNKDDTELFLTKMGMMRFEKKINCW